MIKKDNADPTQDVSINILNSLLRGADEGDHFNFTEKREIEISTGSLILDQFIKIRQGLHRFTGATNAGKTSEAGECLSNLHKTYKAKSIWIKAEGRLSPDMERRLGLKFVYNADEWVMGTVFVLKSNAFEYICSILTGLMKTAYDQDYRLGVVIDSVDALRLKRDDNSELGSEKVAGPQAIMKRFLRRMSLPIAEYGVLCIAISQVSSTVSIDPYTPTDPNAKMGSSSGGNAVNHWANNILEFSLPNKSDFILENPNAEHDPYKNKYLGHWVPVVIRKSDTENKNIRLKYPIKYGRSGGSVWREYEVCDILIGWGLITKKGAWLTFTDDMVNSAKDAGIEIKAQHQGANNLREYIGQNPEILEFLVAKIKPLLQ